MKLATRVQILGEDVFTLLCTNVLGKGMNHMFSLQLWVEQTKLFSLGKTTSLEEGNF